MNVSAAVLCSNALDLARNTLVKETSPSLNMAGEIELHQAGSATTIDPLYQSPKASLLPLIHPSIKQCRLCPDICVRGEGRNTQSEKIAYVSSEPEALINSKVYAWSSNRDLPLEVWKICLNLEEDWVMVKVGEQAKVQRFEGITVVVASNEVEAELIINILARPNVRHSPEFFDHVLDNLRSASAYIVEGDLQQPSSISAECIPIEIHAFHSTPIPTMITSADDLVEQLFRYTLKPLTSDRCLHVHLANLNGLSQLEIYTLLRSIYVCLQLQGLQRPFVSWSNVTLVSNKQKGLGLAVLSLQESWPPENESSNRSLELDLKSKTQEAIQRKPLETTLSIMLPSASRLDAMIRKGCQNLIAAEPEITKFDVITGDGDCGYTLKAGAQYVLDNIKSLHLSNLAASLNVLSEHLQKTMGGTSGALYCIFLSSLSYQLTQDRHSSFPLVLEAAYNELLTFTRARPGDRTCIDTLSGFVKALIAGESSMTAAKIAMRAATETKDMVPRMGRSTYLSDKDCLGTPDPGAWGLAMLLQGICLDS